MDQMGTGEGLPKRLSPEQEAAFQNLRSVGYIVTSPEDWSYNCIAHAADDHTQKWDPTGMPMPGYYWPVGADRSEEIDGLVSAFACLGYEVCAGGDMEDGYEKVALYVDKNGFWTHAAKQLSDGEWTSKLGDCEDIRHRTPHAVSSDLYGQVMFYMRRQRK